MLNKSQFSFSEASTVHTDDSMIIFWILTFPSLTWGLDEESCLEQHFIGKSQDSHPKPGVTCEHTEANDRWRGELRYTILEDFSGIAIEPKYIVQKPECTEKLLFFVNNRLAMYWQHSVQKRIKQMGLNTGNTFVLGSNTGKTFELKIQALYPTEPKCLQGSTTIDLNQLTREGVPADTNIAEHLTLNGTSKKPKTKTMQSLANTEDIPKKETNRRTNETKEGAISDDFFMKDNYRNTIIISLSSALIIFVIAFSVVAIILCKRIREGIMKVDVNNDLYGTYYKGEVEYSEVQDSNPYYGT